MPVGTLDDVSAARGLRTLATWEFQARSLRQQPRIRSTIVIYIIHSSILPVLAIAQFAAYTCIVAVWITLERVFAVVLIRFGTLIRVPVKVVFAVVMFTALLMRTVIVIIAVDIEDHRQISVGIQVTFLAHGGIVVPLLARNDLSAAIFFTTARLWASQSTLKVFVADTATAPVGLDTFSVCEVAADVLIPVVAITMAAADTNVMTVWIAVLGSVCFLIFKGTVECVEIEIMTAIFMETANIMCAFEFIVTHDGIDQGHIICTLTVASCSTHCDVRMPRSTADDLTATGLLSAAVATHIWIQTVLVSHQIEVVGFALPTCALPVPAVA